MTTTILRLQDPVLSTIAYLGERGIAAISETPAEWTYDRLLVLVRDAEGRASGIVLDDVLLTVEVSHPDRATASLEARTVHGLLRAWSETSDRVTFDATIQRPTYDPEPDTRTPAYTFTVRMIFRAETVAVER